MLTVTPLFSSSFSGLTLLVQPPIKAVKGHRVCVCLFRSLQPLGFTAGSGTPSKGGRQHCLHEHLAPEDWAWLRLRLACFVALFVWIILEVYSNKRIHVLHITNVPWERETRCSTSVWRWRLKGNLRIFPPKHGCTDKAGLTWSGALRQKWAAVLLLTPTVQCIQYSFAGILHGPRVTVW